MPGFKTFTRDGVALAVGQQVNTPFTLEVGDISEQVTVTAEAPVLDTTSVSSGANFDKQLVDSLPMFSNMPIMLARFAPGVNPNDAQPQVSQGFVTARTRRPARRSAASAATPTPSTARPTPAQPPAGHLAQCRHGSGDARRDVELRRVGGPWARQPDLHDDARRHERVRGTANYQYWTNRLNALNVQQKTTFNDVARERVRGRAVRTTSRSRSADRSTFPSSSTAAASCSSSPTIHTCTTRFPGETWGRVRSRPTRSICRATSPTCCDCRTRTSTSSTIR